MTYESAEISTAVEGSAGPVSLVGAANRRLASLWATGLLDSPAEPRFDRLTRLAAASVRAPVALISLVDDHRQFFKSALGLPEPWASLRETKLSHSFCRHVVELRAPLVVDDARVHPLVSRNLAITDLNVIAYLGVPLRAPDGFVLGSLCAIDSSPRAWSDADLALLHDVAALVEDEIAAREAAVAMIDSETQWRDVLNAVPQMLWTTLADGSVDYFNDRWYDFTGVAYGATDGDAWPHVFHPDDQARAREVWHHAVSTGSLYEIEYRLRHRSGEYRWALGRAVPMRDAQGRIVRWLGTCTDIDALKRSEEARELISQELSHRIKNIFAVVSAIVTLSARDAPEAAAYSARLRDRLLALAAAHDYVRPHSDVLRAGADAGRRLDGLLDSLLLPYRTTGNRIVIAQTGVRVGITAATALALVMHELATNAVKYGALSQPGGTVTLTCEAGDLVRIVWRERGGPAIEAAPARSGFGSSMLMRAATMQLGGKLAHEWDAAGLTVTFETTADRLVG